MPLHCTVRSQTYKQCLTNWKTQYNVDPRCQDPNQIRQLLQIHYDILNQMINQARQPVGGGIGQSRQRAPAPVAVATPEPPTREGALDVFFSTYVRWI